LLRLVGACAAAVAIGLVLPGSDAVVAAVAAVPAAFWPWTERSAMTTNHFGYCDSLGT
jgi:hypothetical protein